MLSKFYHAMNRNKSFDRGRNGFTIVELLIVIAIIGLLLALLLPAVQAAREAARRLRCLNNMKQCGMALQLHHDTRGKLPSGMLASPPKSYALQADGVKNDTLWHAWGWAPLIFPYMEQTTLYDQLGIAKRHTLESAFEDQNVRPLLITKLNVLICPSDVGNDPNEKVLLGLPDRDDIYAFQGRSNYLACRVFMYIGMLSRPGKPAYKTCKTDVTAMTANSEFTLTDITDGTSNTFALGERTCLDAAKGGGWVGVPRIRIPDMVFGYGSLKLNSLDERGAMSSIHPGGANFTFWDGSVRFIPDTIAFSMEKPNPAPEKFNPGTIATNGDIRSFYMAAQHGTLGVYQLLFCKDDGQTVSF